MALQALTTETILNRLADITDTSIENVSSADAKWLKENM